MVRCAKVILCCSVMSLRHSPLVSSRGFLCIRHTQVGDGMSDVRACSAGVAMHPDACNQRSIANVPNDIPPERCRWITSVVGPEYIEHSELTLSLALWDVMLVGSTVRYTSITW